MGIDIRTLILIIGITHVMQLLIFYNQFKSNRDLSGPGWWLMWSGVESLGFGLLLLRSIPSILPVVIIFQNIIILTGTIFIYIGIVRFFNQKVNLKLLIPALGGYIVLHLFFVWVYDSIEIRTLLLDICLSVIAFLTAFILYKNKTIHIASSVLFNIVIFVIHGSVFALRSIMISLGVPVTETFIPNLFNLAQYFDALLASLLWTFGFIMMMNQRLHAEMAEAKAHFELIFNTSPDAVVISRMSDGLFIDCNEGFCKITGYRKEEILGKSSLDIKLWANPAQRDSIVRIIAANGFCDNQEFQFQLKNGEIITGLLSAKQVDLNGVPHLISVTRDITYRKKAELEIRTKNKELQKMNAEKDKFFSIISHDLLSPFNGFLGLTQVMAEKLPGLTMAEIQKIANGLRKSAINLYSLLGNLLEWSRKQRGLTIFSPTSFLLLPKISESIVLATEAASAKEITVTCDVPEGIAVFADINMFAGIVRNLVTNAVKFTPRGGKIRILAKSIPGNFIEISVQDTGIGMAKDRMNNLFRLEVDTSRKGTEGELSTGLGLMICKDFIEMHGGELTVESAVGRGSMFRFTIPANENRKNNL